MSSQLRLCPPFNAGSAKAAAKASYLPESFEVALVENLCPNQAQPPGQKKARTGRSKPRAESKPDKAPAKRSAEQPTECVASHSNCLAALAVEGVHAAILCHVCIIHSRQLMN